MEDKPMNNDMLWAAFFTACGAKFDYSDSEFILRDVEGRDGGTVILSTKPKTWQAKLGTFPTRREGLRTLGALERFIFDQAYEEPYPFNYEPLDGDHFGFFIGINKNSSLEMFGHDANYLEDMDEKRTFQAYKSAMDHVR